MSTTPLADDIAYVRQMAEEGATAPSLTGRFSLWWSVLVIIALATHWSVLTGNLPLAEQQIGLIWITFAIIGIVGNGILAKTIRDKPGGSAPGNRVSQTVWQVMTAGLFLYGAALGFGVALRDLPPLLFDTFLPLAFMLYAINAASAATLFRTSLPWFTVGVSLLVAALCAFLIGSPTAYLIAIVGVFIAMVLPAIQTLRAEPQSVV